MSYQETFFERNFPFIIMFGVFGLLITTMFYAVYLEQQHWERLRVEIPEMDCKELTAIHNKYDYWLDDPDSEPTKVMLIWERYDLFDMWYERAQELECSLL